MATARVTAGTARMVIDCLYTIIESSVQLAATWPNFARHDEPHRLSRATPTPRRIGLQRQAVGAVRRRPRAAEHRARMHRPACRRATRPRSSSCNAAGGDEILSFRQICEDSSRFAHWLVAKGVAPGDRVAIMLEPSRAFYAAVFGAMKPGAIAVPLFTLFGPDGVRLRVDDCTPKLLIEDDATSSTRARAPSRRAFDAEHPRRRSRDLPVHLGHDARAAGGGEAHASRHRHADGGGALRHRPAAGRPLLLPVVAGLGSRPVARHAGAAGARPHDRRLCRQVRRGAAAAGAAGASLHQPVGRGDALPHDAHLGRGAEASLLPRQDLLHRRADRQRDGDLLRGDLRPAGVQHVRHDRDRRDPGELSRRAGLRRQAGLARQADPGRQGRGAGRRRQAVPAGRDRRDQGLAARRLDRDQGSRPHRRGRLLLPRRPRRRRHHLRRLDDERDRDRGRDAEASRRARGRRDRRARRAARPGGEGLRRRRPHGRRRASPRKSRTSCARASASTNIRASSSSSPSCRRRRPARSIARCLRTKEKANVD